MEVETQKLVKIASIFCISLKNESNQMTLFGRSKNKSTFLLHQGIVVMIWKELWTVKYDDLGPLQRDFAFS